MPLVAMNHSDPGPWVTPSVAQRYRQRKDETPGSLVDFERLQLLRGNAHDKQKGIYNDSPTPVPRSPAYTSLSSTTTWTAMAEYDQSESDTAASSDPDDSCRESPIPPFDSTGISKFDLLDKEFCPSAPRQSTDETGAPDAGSQQKEQGKPPHSYAMLIYMAIKHHGGGKIALAQIYSYIMNTFAYYKQADPGWKNSIRHNLTQHECFLKIARNAGEPGKGGFWALDKSYEGTFASGDFKGAARKVLSRRRKESTIKKVFNSQSSDTKGKLRQKPFKKGAEIATRRGTQIAPIKIRFPKMLSVPSSPSTPSHSTHIMCDGSNDSSRSVESGAVISQSRTASPVHQSKRSRSKSPFLVRPTTPLSGCLSATTVCGWGLSRNSQVFPGVPDDEFFPEDYDHLDIFSLRKLEHGCLTISTDTIESGWDHDANSVETILLPDSSVEKCGAVTSICDEFQFPAVSPPTITHLSDVERSFICSPLDILCGEHILQPSWTL